MSEPPDAWEEQLRRTAQQMVYPPTPALSKKGLFSVRRTMRSARWQWATIAILLVVVVGLLSVPSVRAGLVDMLQIGSVRIWLGQPTPTVVARPTSDLGEVMTLAEAQAQMDFPLRVPALPEGIGLPDEVVLLTQEEDGGVGLTWYNDNGTPFVRLYEFGAGFWAQKWGPAQEPHPYSASVNGEWAAWLPGPHRWEFIGNNGPRTLEVTEGKAVLIWSENDVTYRLESSLTMQEAENIAESLREIE